MSNLIKSIVLSKLIAHPANANRMSRTTFAKLVRNIRRTGLYEPLVVRPHPQRQGCFEIINGFHRFKAAAKLGYKAADCVVWDVDDEQALILLATLNRLSGTDEVTKKIELLKKLNEKMAAAELSKLLPQRKKQIEQLCNLKFPALPVKLNAKPLVEPVVFFVTDSQKQIIEKALGIGLQDRDEKTQAEKRAAALTQITQYFVNNSKFNSRT